VAASIIKQPAWRQAKEKVAKSGYVRCKDISLTEAAELFHTDTDTLLKLLPDANALSLVTNALSPTSKSRPTSMVAELEKEVNFISEASDIVI
jgi:hypothetical protein